MKWRYLLVMGAVVAFAKTCSINADEANFMGMPGLWKTELRLTNAASTSARIVWHCVDEDADPWAAFAQIEPPPDESCTRKSYQRTPTTLQWDLECAGSIEMSSSGLVSFDTAQHYRGKVLIKGLFMGYPIDEYIDVEGTRQAACTSPQD